MKNLINKRKIRVPVPFKKAFTLIELLVWISISVILMISVSVFVSSGMKNILDINKVLENSWDFNDFSSSLQNAFNYTGSWKYIKIISSTGVLFKRDQYFWQWGFSYIWEIVQDKFYCATWSESTSTNHIILKTFVPFEEEGENMFSVWWYDKIFTWSSDSSNTYISYALEHVVKKNWNIIIWKWIYWDKFENGAFWTGIYLNNPTGLAMSGSVLFISDTLNNRVLYYKNWRIYKLLDEFDWLSEPTGLYYNAWKLYISNSWKWEILEYSSPVMTSAPTLTMTGFSKNINKVDITFFWNNSPGLLNTWNFNITWNSTSPNYLTWTIDNLKKYFVTINSESVQLWCALWWQIIFSWWKPSIYCTKTWSWKTANYPTSFISKIDINSLNWFTSTWTYYVDLKLYNWSTLKYKKYYPYFTQWDGDILTPGDNTLIVFTGGLNYPTGIWWTWANQYNEFNKIWRTYDFQNTWYNKISDYILKTPLKSLIVAKTGNLFTLFMKYYKNYNCYNLDDNAQRSYILKKKF